MSHRHRRGGKQHARAASVRLEKYGPLSYPVVATILVERLHHAIGLVCDPTPTEWVQQFEGGSMRGVVSAGMVTGLEYLNLLETFDVVYGTAAVRPLIGGASGPGARRKQARMFAVVQPMRAAHLGM